MRLARLVVVCSVIALLACGAVFAQQSIRQLVPSDSQLVVVVDGRPENPSIQTLTNATDEKTREIMECQREALLKAVESFATLFGVSLDFAKDIQSWAGYEWAFVLLPGEKDDVQPVFMIASKDAAAANAALEKFLEPWERLGEVGNEADSQYPILSFKVKDKVEVFASAYGSVLAISPSMPALKRALAGSGYPAGSLADKTLTAFSDSFLYAYVDPQLFAKKINMRGMPVPLDAAGLGVSVIETGARLKVVGILNKDITAVAGQALPTMPTGPVCANGGIPSSSLAAISIMDLDSLIDAATTFIPVEALMATFIGVLENTHPSSAITAALPIPAGIAVLEAESEQAAADKMQVLVSTLKELEMVKGPSLTISGIEVTPIELPRGANGYLAQVGKSLIVATDKQSLKTAARTATGTQPRLVDLCAYNETIAGLGNSNLVTTYVNLAPIQGIGYLIEGSGLGQLEPAYGVLAKGLQSAKALGIGFGFDGEMASATLFLRAKPGAMPTVGVTAVSLAAVGAAIMLPAFGTFGSDRDVVEETSCENNIRQLITALELYAMDHNGKLPTAANWESELLPNYYRGEVECTEGNWIVFNKNLGGLNLNKILNPSEVVVFFEGPEGLPNSSGSRNDAVFPHDGQGYFAFLDGHVEFWDEAPPQSSWVPKYEQPKAVKKAPAKKTTTKKKRK